jgi:lysophospholipase L1-like esterase
LTYLSKIYIEPISYGLFNIAWWLAIILGMSNSLIYVALGGTGTAGPTSWPHGLTAPLAASQKQPVKLINLAVDDATIAGLIATQLPAAIAARPDFVSVQIGWNDYLDGFEEPYYHARVVELYDRLAALVSSAQRVLAVALPYPSGSEQTERLRAYNAAAAVTAELRGFTWAAETEQIWAQAGQRWCS